MNIAEKITILRKKQGWSQEELAYKLDVSRQAVSKWESSGAIPDIDKVLAMSKLFNVSCDALLKEEQVTDKEVFGESEQEAPKIMSDEEVDKYLEMSKKHSVRISIAVALCIISPIMLILLGVLSQIEFAIVTENMALAIGMSALVVLVAIAVAIFISSGMAFSKYEFLESDKLMLSNDSKVRLIAEKEAYEPKFVVALTTGVVLCILSILPLMIAPAFEPSDLVYVICLCILFFVVAIAVVLFIIFGNKHIAYKLLLEEGEYSIKNKRKFNLKEIIASAFWCLAVAIYLTWSFISGNWDFTWIVWPIAAVLYGVFEAIFRGVTQGK